jgi:hypothetical protein
VIEQFQAQVVHQGGNQRRWSARWNGRPS